MKVHELIHELSSMDPDAEVRLAHQPNWPLEVEVGVVVETDPTEGLDIIMGRPWSAEEDTYWWVFTPDDEDYEPHGPFVDANGALTHIEQLKHEHTPIVYITEGQHLGYLSTEGRRAIGW